MRDPSDRTNLERRILVTAPPELAELTRTGDPRVLDQLVELLAEPDRAWAAQVALSAMTRRDEKTVEAFARMPEQWLESLGPGAQARWEEWLAPRRGRLAWDGGRRLVVERGEPRGGGPRPGPATRAGSPASGGCSVRKRSAARRPPSARRPRAPCSAMNSASAPSRRVRTRTAARSSPSRCA